MTSVGQEPSCPAQGAAAASAASAEVLGLQLRLSDALGALPRIRPAKSTLLASTLGCVAGDRRRDAGPACNVTVLCYSLVMSAIVHSEPWKSEPGSVLETRLSGAKASGRRYLSAFNSGKQTNNIEHRSP